LNFVPLIKPHQLTFIFSQSFTWKGLEFLQQIQIF